MADGDATEFQNETLNLARDTLKGQLRDLVLDHMMHERKNTLPWNMWGESEQQATIDRIDASVSAAVTRAVQIMAADGKQTVVASIESVTAKDNLKLVAKAMLTDRNLVFLAGRVNTPIMIVVADDTAYDGGQERRPEALQRNLDIDGDEGDGGGDDPGPVFDNTDAGKPKGPRGKK